MAVTIQKIIGSSEGNADNGLSARNKINSNFQNLVDAILSIQVEAGTTSFENLTGKPSTLKGYGIADSYDKTQVDTLLSGKMSSAIFNDLFEKVNIGTELAPVYAIKAKYDFYGIGEVSAYGIGIGGSGGSGLIQTVYGYNNLGGAFLDSNLTDTFNAYTINKLASRITTLEGGTSSNISISTTGAGNAITSATKLGDVITFAKDSTFILTNDYRLTNARYNPYALTFTGYLSAVYDGSNSVSIALPTKLSQFTNDIGAGTSITKAQVEGVLTGTITSHTHNYLTGNQTISVTGDATGSGTTSIALTLANSGVTAGTYRSVTVDAKGRVTAGTNPTTLAGYGIIDAANLTHTHNYAGSSSAGGKANAVANKLTFSGYSSLSYDGSTAVTIPIPNNTNQLTNGAGFITSSGNAATATALSSSRTFALTGVVTGTIASDLTSGFTINTSISANSIALGTNTVGNYAATIGVSGNGLTITGSAGEGTAYTVNSNATNLNTASTVVFRDVNGNFSAGTITAALSGNATTSTTLQTIRTLWGQSFNGSANVTGALSSVTDVTMTGTLSIGSAQFIYDSGTNTIRVQKSDGTAIGFYSTGEVASYGVGSAGGNSYVTATKFIVSGDIVSNNSIYTGGKTSSIDGLPGTVFNKAGGLEICGPNPLIDFHYNSSTEDFTSRLIEFFSGQISISNKFRVGDMYTYNGSYAFYVKGTSYLNGDTTINGAINSTGTGTFTGGSFSSLRSLKTVHKDWQGNALDEIAKFKVRDFNYKNQLDCNRTLGFIVDEIPESVSDYVLANETRNAINLYTLHALSFKAHQETKSEVDKLKEKIISLKNEIDYLKIKLN